LIPYWHPSDIPAKPFLLGALLWVLGIVVLIFAIANTSDPALSSFLIRLLGYWLVGAMAAFVLIAMFLGWRKEQEGKPLE